MVPCLRQRTPSTRFDASMSLEFQQFRFVRAYANYVAHRSEDVNFLVFYYGCNYGSLFTRNYTTSFGDFLVQLADVQSTYEETCVPMRGEAFSRLVEEAESFQFCAVSLDKPNDSTTHPQPFTLRHFIKKGTIPVLRWSSFPHWSLFDVHWKRFSVTMPQLMLQWIASERILPNWMTPFS